MNRRTYLALAGAIATPLAGCVDRERGDTPSDSNVSTPTTEAETIHAEYETTTVRAVTPAGETLGSVTAAIADTGDLRYRGLSDTAYLPADRGMLFVYESVADRSFVMRRMDFGIDIVYAAADGTITQIHHAPEPGPGEDGSEQRYPGRGQYVLEVAYNWTRDYGVSEGDELAFTLP